MSASPDHEGAVLQRCDLIDERWHDLGLRIQAPHRESRVLGGQHLGERTHAGADGVLHVGVPTDRRDRVDEHEQRQLTGRLASGERLRQADQAVRSGVDLAGEILRRPG